MRAVARRLIEEPIPSRQRLRGVVVPRRVGVEVGERTARSERLVEERSALRGAVAQGSLRLHHRVAVRGEPAVARQRPGERGRRLAGAHGLAREAPHPCHEIAVPLPIEGDHGAGPSLVRAPVREERLRRSVVGERALQRAQAQRQPRASRAGAAPARVRARRVVAHRPRRRAGGLGAGAPRRVACEPRDRLIAGVGLVEQRVARVGGLAQRPQGAAHRVPVGGERGVLGPHPGERGRELARVGRLARERRDAPVQRRAAAPVQEGPPARASAPAVSRPVFEQRRRPGVQATRALECGDRAGEALRRPLDPGGLLRAQHPGAPERRDDAAGPGGVAGERGDRPSCGGGLFAPRVARGEAGLERAEHVHDAPAHRLACTVLGEHVRERLGQPLGRGAARRQREHGGKRRLVALGLERILAARARRLGEGAPVNERRPVHRLLAQRPRRRDGRGGELRPDRFERGEFFGALRLERLDERFAVGGQQHHVVARAGELDVEARLIGDRGPGRRRAPR